VVFGEIVYRAARSDEAAEIAGFHVDVWRKTYRDIAPARALEVLDAAHRLPVWQATLGTPKPRQHTVVAVWQGRIVGLISLGPAGHPAFGDAGEIKHLYVDTACHGHGIGRQLLRRALVQLASDGFGAAGLAVVQENAPALGFYNALGGVQVGHFTDEGPIWKSRNLIIGWDLPVEVLNPS